MKLRAHLAVSILVLGLALSGPWVTAEAQSNSDLAGAWLVTGWESADGEVNSSPQRGLFVFTASGHYSIMYVPGSEPRAEYAGETQTEAEILAAYGSFIANSGRYSIEGDQITYEASMAKDPNYMAGFAPTGGDGNAQVMNFSLENGVLTLTWPVGGGAFSNQGQKATLSRPGGAEE